MNSLKVFALVILFALLLGACQPAAAPEIYRSETIEQPDPNLDLSPNDMPELPAIPGETEAGMQAEPYHSPPFPTSAPGFPSGGYPPYDQSPPDNTFQDYGVNPFMDAREDHLSTFAVDVDTASYTVAQRYLSDGMLPPPEAVRVEEFVNYFDQQYPDTQEAAFMITADGAPSPFDAGLHLVRVGIQGRRVSDWARKPANLIFVIDVSGSMDIENRLELVKQSLELLVDSLNNDDTIGIIVYGTEARTVLEPVSAGNRRLILRAIRSLRPEGSTNAEAGLRLGYEHAMRAYNPGGINRIILCSDGVANVGLTGPEAILETVRGYVEEGILLTTVGFGMGNFNDVLMEQLADQGNGFYAYVDDLDEARKIFVEDLTSTLQVIALDAKIQVDFNPEQVAYYRLLGYENRDVADQDFRNDAVDAGEIGAGHAVTALYAVSLYPEVEGRIATIQLRWQDPETYQVQEINQNLNTWDLARRFEQADPHFQLSVLVGQFAEVLRQSSWARETSISSLLEYAYSLPRSLQRQPEVAEFISLVRQAADLQW